MIKFWLHFNGNEHSPEQVLEDRLTKVVTEAKILTSDANDHLAYLYNAAIEIENRIARVKAVSDQADKLSQLEEVE